MPAPTPTPRGGTAYTRAERAFVLLYGHSMTDEEMAAQLGRSEHSIKQYRQRCGIHRPSQSSVQALGAVPSKPRGFTAEQHEWALRTLKLHHPKPQDRLEAGLILAMINDPAAKGLA